MLRKLLQHSQLKCTLLLFSISIFAISFGQQIKYSEPDREDKQNMDFEIIGKQNGNFLIYKNNNLDHQINIYDNDMHLTDKVKLDYLPERVFNTDFIPYQGFIYMFYQYQKKNIVYAMAVKLDGNGKKVGEILQLDTTNINYSASDKIYSLLVSEDKQKIMLAKVNSKSEKTHYITTVLFNAELALLNKSQASVSMPERNSFLTEFAVDNDGDFICLKANGNTQNDNIGKIFLLRKPYNATTTELSDMRIGNIFLDDVKIKVDNINKRYLVTAFYSKQKRGNIDGLYLYLFNKSNLQEDVNTTIGFSEEIREEAKGENSVKAAFNDYFIRNIVMKKDGGFLLTAESAYTSSRGNNYNRWDYFGSPYYPGTAFNNYYYGGFGAPVNTYFYPWNRFNSFNNITRFFSDNIVVFSLTNQGKIDWANIINKSQYDDNSDKFIGYGLVNSGNQMNFLFNIQEKRQSILSSQSIDPTGQITRNPTFKNLDKGYDFMPRNGKQTGLRQVIIPCMYRNYVCFAKIDL